MSGISAHDRSRLAEIFTEAEGDWFTAELLRLVAKADPDNRWRLALGFPEEVAAYTEWMAGDAAGWMSLPDSPGTPLAGTVTRLVGRRGAQHLRTELHFERAENVSRVPIVVGIAPELAVWTGRSLLEAAAEATP